MQTWTEMCRNILTTVNLYLLNILQQMADWFECTDEFGAIFF